MINLSVPYGKSEEHFSLPDEMEINYITANPLTPVKDFKEHILHKLEHPTGTRPFKDIFNKGEKVVIVVSDVTRLWVRSYDFLPVLINELNKLGIPDEDISLVMSTGDHREQSREEHRLIVGEEVLERVKIFDHDCFADDLVSLGVTSRGTNVYLNRQVHEADRVIITGGICYHLLAGFGGGRKSLAPGVSGYTTIQENHGLAIKAGPGQIGTGILDGNPVAQDMDEAAAMVDPDFLLNVVVNEKKEFIGITAGHWRAAHLEGTKIVEEAFGIPIAKRADVVIASSGGYPKDIQLYQSIKTLDNAYYAARDGGSIILVSECFDGPGPEAYLSWFKYDSYEKMARALYEGFTMPGFVALRTAEVQLNKTVYLVSSLEREVVERVGMRPVSSIDEGLKIIQEKQQVKSVHIMPHGSITYPIVK
ncbi:nickel-dependent lactate racemase [Desulfitibacter alkalitolerans]|uniref:nickel-dependent lactate racemase n=1 Tax=Desulfitibacter alkalitolerans TaxID=264641 RepID=UPI000488290A|nr:nickel-dependent lactate racemase [Desulfitibacter alkalitolerans]